jgi:pilus assembly protein CpaB
MKPKTLILMVVAVGCGLVAAFLVKAGMSKDSTPKESYLVAKDPLPLGSKILSVEDQFIPKDFLPGTAPPGAVKNDEESKKKLKDAIVTTAIDKDAVITDNHIRDVSIASKLKPGQRAIAVPVNVNTAVAGFIAPDVTVDLMVNYSKGSEPVVSTFLQNVRILAVNTMMSKPAEGPQGAASPNLSNITVAVTPEESQIITLAQRLGSISLALRSPADFVDPSGNPIVSIPVATKGITLKELVDIYGVLRPQLVEAILPAQ